MGLEEKFEKFSFWTSRRKVVGFLNFFSYGLVENLILGKNQEKKSLKFRDSRDIPALPGALFFGKKIFFSFFWLREVLFQFLLTFQIQFFYICVHVLCKKLILKGKIEIERELPEPIFYKP